MLSQIVEVTLRTFAREQIDLPRENLPDLPEVNLSQVSLPQVKKSHWGKLHLDIYYG